MSFYQKNMELLVRRNPALAEEMNHTAVPETIRIVKSSSGSPTLLWAAPSAKPRFLHSPQDPRLEAGRLVQKHLFRNPDGTLLLGFGLGYLAMAVHRKKEPHHLLCIAEAIPGMFRLALEQRDLSDLLADEETHFFIGDGVRAIVDGFRPLRLKAITGDFNKIALPVFMELYGGFYDAIETRIHEHLTSLRQGFTTFRATMGSSVSNLFANLPTVIRSQPVNNLSGLLKGKPAVVVAAGPSLSREMETLKKVRRECPILCVDTALKPLLENGIVPDLAVTCDPQELTYQKIAQVEPEALARMPLLFCADSFRKVVDSFGTIRFVAGSDSSLGRWLLGRCSNISVLPFYGTVAHLAFAAARFMAADPIILVGLDLSFPGESAHAKGCTATWEIDMKAWKNPIGVPANNGGQAKTTLPFITMIRQFESDIEKTGARCVNVSKDGARIRGAEWMDLEEAAALGGGRPCDMKPLLAQAHRRKSGAPPKPDLRPHLEWLLSEASELEDLIGGGTGTFPRYLQKKKLLQILFDCFPRYLISFPTIPKEGFPAPDWGDEDICREQSALFLEEAREIIPLLKAGCLETIQLLEDPLCRYEHSKSSSSAAAPSR